MRLWSTSAPQHEAPWYKNVEFLLLGSDHPPSPTSASPCLFPSLVCVASLTLCAPSAPTSPNSNVQCSLRSVLRLARASRSPRLTTCSRSDTSGSRESQLVQRGIFLVIKHCTLVIRLINILSTLPSPVAHGRGADGGRASGRRIHLSSDR